MYLQKYLLINAVGIKVGGIVLYGIDVPYNSSVCGEEGNNVDVSGTVVWRKIESLIDMCRAADRIILLEHVFRSNRKRC